VSYWYGFSFEDVANMPMSAISAYLERLPARQAEWKMLMADPIALPHMKESDRRAMVNSWNTTMLKDAPARVATPAKLKMMGIGVRFVQ
jgi:mannitol/fructose-specific phosphotransferase system IIA component